MADLTLAEQKKVYRQRRCAREYVRRRLEALFKHVRDHGMDSEFYKLKYKFDGQITGPLVKGQRIIRCPNENSKVPNRLSTSDATSPDDATKEDSLSGRSSDSLG